MKSVSIALVSLFASVSFATAPAAAPVTDHTTAPAAGAAIGTGETHAAGTKGAKGAPAEEQVVGKKAMKKAKHANEKHAEKAAAAKEEAAAPATH